MGAPTGTSDAAPQRSTPQAQLKRAQQLMGNLAQSFVTHRLRRAAGLADASKCESVDKDACDTACMADSACAAALTPAKAKDPEGCDAASKSASPPDITMDDMDMTTGLLTAAFCEKYGGWCAEIGKTEADVETCKQQAYDAVWPVRVPECDDVMATHQDCANRTYFKNDCLSTYDDADGKFMCAENFPESCVADTLCGSYADSVLLATYPSGSAAGQLVVSFIWTAAFAIFAAVP